MKELEKVKRISIASTLFILIILIGVLSFKRPKNMYALNTKNTLEKLTTNNYLISINDLDKPEIVLIDVRSQYEYEKGHLENAINLPSPEILSDENQQIFKEIVNLNKTAVIYGKNPQEANIPFLILYQLGFDNIKLLNAENSFNQNKLINNETQIETYKNDIQSFINQSAENLNAALKAKETEPPKKTIIVKKKKKKVAEGGC